MTERGLPTEGAPACPFVAFEDDRDGRSTAPDHRHRCFAEPRPAPRALAHQEAYCLSSAFPVCPTFQDWARREAAAARPSAAAPAAAAPRDETPAPQSRPMPPVEREGRHAPPADVPSVPPRRPGQREWAAPPPWLGDDPRRGADPEGASDPGDPDDVDGPAASRGLAGSAAYRLAGPDPSEPPPAQPERDDRLGLSGAHDRYLPPERRSGAADAGAADDDLDDDWAAGAAGAGAYVAGAATARTTAGAARYEPPARRDPAARREAGGRGGDAARRDARDQEADRAADARRRDREQDAQELFGPAWERPRRYEAYPKLSTRVGLPGVGAVPRVALWGGLLVVAALAIFLLGPRLLGLSKSDNGTAGGPSPSVVASVEPSDEPTATPEPAPTPQVYRVARGDTMSKIAKKFGLTIEQLLAANKQVKDPNKIKIGDPITIPVPVEDGGSDGSVGGESTAP